MKLSDARVWLSVLFLCGLFHGRVDAANLGEAREDWDRWIELQKTIQKTQADWLVEKEALRQMSDLLRTQRDLLKTTLDRAKEEASAGDQERRKLSVRQSRLVQVEAELDRVIRVAEERGRKLSEQFPPPLKQKVGEFLARMPQEGQETSLGLGRRMQNLLAFMNEADKFNVVLTLTKELQPISGAEVQVDVMYLGLASAFYVDPEGRRAGVGYPGEQGWKWEPRDDQCVQIKKLMDMYRGDQVPALVNQELEVR